MSKSIANGLLALILLAAYANHFQNSFHFDDAHTIVNNAAIQDLKNIPLFFKDARSFSSLPSNQSYRPLVSTLFAIDYALGGMNPWPYHLSIFAIFVALVLLLAFVINDLIENVWIAFGAAALFGLHPANADTMNYVIASAEIISTLGIVASFAIYLAFPDLRRYFLFVLPAAIAILAKPPAAIFPVLLATYLFLFSEWRSKRCLLEVAGSFAVCAATLLFVQQMTPQGWVAGARSAHDYLITQPYVALLYFKTFFWPTNLSADYDLNPLTTTDDARFWSGLLFVIVLLTMSILCARSSKMRVIGFGLLWFFIALLPTSLFPLAEVMNDHRTFLPYIGLIIAIAGGAACILTRRSRVGRTAATALGAVTVLILCASAFATFERNKVWRTEETLWRDVTIKSPQNSRGLMNYGNTLMGKGDFNGALDYFHRALALAPHYSVLFVNLGAAESATNQNALAEQHFKEALRLAPRSPESYTFYARHLLAHSQSNQAERLVRSALAFSPTDLMARDLLQQIERQENAAGPETKTPEEFLNQSLELYRSGRFEEAIAAAQRAVKLRPDYAEAWNNICAANNKLGRYEDAASACETALRYKPDFDLARNNLRCAKEHCR